MSLDHPYWKLPELEERFNSSSESIRGLASAWLVGMFAAIAWLLSNQNDMRSLAPIGLLIVMICTVATGGFGVLWIMDQLVFHRLLQAVFLTGLYMEFCDSKLPPFRSMMMKIQESIGTSRWEQFFYLGLIVTCIFISGFAIFKGDIGLFNDASGKNDIIAYHIAIIFLILQLFFGIFLFKKQNSNVWVKQAKLFGNHEFAKIIEKKLYVQIIGRFTPPSS